MSQTKPAPRVFNPMREPFTITEIAGALGASWHAVHYAYASLNKRAATRAIVRPVDGAKPMMLDARAADLIARHLNATAERKRERQAALRNARRRATRKRSGSSEEEIGRRPS